VNDPFDQLTCETCGGRIGAAAGDGVKPCKCFSKPAAKPAAALKASPEAMVGSEYMEPDVPGDDTKPAAQPGQKLCRVCGKDLTGRSRLKDAQGYLCKDCADAEDVKEADLIKCPECERRLKPGAFTNYRGTRICKSCHAFHLETDKVKVGKVDTSHYANVEKEKVKKLAILAGVLLVLMAIGAWKFFSQ
jgi:hypothetical protein